MICLFGYTLNIVQAFEDTWIMLIAFYVSPFIQLPRICRIRFRTIVLLTCLQLTQRMFNGAYYLWICYVLPQVAGYMMLHVIAVAVPVALWIATIQLEYPSRLGLVWVAIALGTPDCP